jgi:hypothetical protein
MEGKYLAVGMWNDDDLFVGSRPVNTVDDVDAVAAFLNQEFGFDEGPDRILFIANGKGPGDCPSVVVDKNIGF